MRTFLEFNAYSVVRFAPEIARTDIKLFIKVQGEFQGNFKNFLPLSKQFQNILDQRFNLPFLKHFLRQRQQIKRDLC